MSAVVIVCAAFAVCLVSAQSEQCALNPNSYHIKIGAVSGIITTDGPIAIPANFFSVPNEAVTRSYNKVYRATDPIIWQQNIPVLDTPDGRVIVDTGAFNTGLPPFANAGKLIPNLRVANIDPDSIDAVLLTHGHPDHVADLINENGKPAFKNAQVYVSKTEHEFWTAEPFINPSPTVPNATLTLFSNIYRQSVAPYEKSGKLILVEDEKRPLHGVRYVLYPGHTPGHSAVEITSEGERLVIAGDTWFSQPDQIRNPEWTRPVKTNGLQGFESRVRLMETAAKRKDTVLAFHEDFPGLGHIVVTADSFDWVPARPQNLGAVKKKC